jgi:hypothetical protein
MQDNNGQRRQHRVTPGNQVCGTQGISSSFAELVGGCDDWVREIRSILQIQKNHWHLHTVGNARGEGPEKRR